MTSVAGIEQELTDHGLAFLARSISSLRDEESSRGPLFAVVDVAVAIEALLKARLAREHWSLVLADPDRASLSDFRAGKAKTVSPDSAISRLKKLAGVELPVSETHIKEVFSLRNRTMHFTVPSDLESIGVRATYGRALNAALSILEGEFRGRVDRATGRQISDVIEALMAEVVEINSLVTDRMAAISPELSAADLYLECPRCRQFALTFSEQSEEVSCAFCLWRSEAPDLAAFEYVTTVQDVSEYEIVTDGDQWPIWGCWNCDQHAVVEVRPRDRSHMRSRSGDDSHPSNFYACFGCASTGEIGRFSLCSTCARTLTEDAGTCPTCLAEAVHRND